MSWGIEKSDIWLPFGCSKVIKRDVKSNQSHGN